MQRFDITRMCSERGLRETPYLEFLRVPAMSAGLYRLPVGALDRQQPHYEDEVYYILKGRGMIQVGDESQPGDFGPRAGGCLSSLLCHLRGSDGAGALRTAGSLIIPGFGDSAARPPLARHPSQRGR